MLSDVITDQEPTVTEPAIVAYGRHNIREFTEDEYRDSLKGAFADNNASFITLDSNMRGQRFLAAAVAWGIDHELLTTEFTDGSDEQCEVSSFRLTDAGKKEFGITR